MLTESVSTKSSKTILVLFFKLFLQSAINYIYSKILRRKLRANSFELRVARPEAQAKSFEANQDWTTSYKYQARG